MTPNQKIKYSFIKIITGSDLFIKRIPFMMMESCIPGPVVWLTACGHGDEVGGIVVIHELFKKIKKNPLLKGSVYAFPLMNPLGFETSSRNISLTKEDLNRSFPGNKHGSLAERMAYKIFTTIIQTNPSIVLDLHNDWIKSIPYILNESKKSMKSNIVHQKIKILSKKSGFLNISDNEELPTSLTYCLIQQGIPAITYELGESYIVNEMNIKYGVKSVYNILSYLEMVPQEKELFEYALPNEYKKISLNYSNNPLSSSSGIIRFFVKPGDVVKAGQPIAKIYNSFGKPQETIEAINNGIVLGHTDSSVVFPGVPIMAFGIY